MERLVGAAQRTLPRLHSLLTQLPTHDLPPLLLDVGCGVYAASVTMRTALPGWELYGIDLDSNALRRARHLDPELRLVRADARSLPGLLHTHFGLILVRHPDLYLHPTPWQQILMTLPHLLAPAGFLIITLYAPEEIEMIERLGLPPRYPDMLAPTDLAGQDRFVLVYR